MNRRRALVAALASMLLAPPAFAQIPGVTPDAGTSAVPTTPGGAAGAASTAAGAAGGAKNLWSFLCMTPEQMAACQQKLCNCSIGKMISAMLTPVGALTGGLLGPICPGPNSPNPADLNQPADSAQGAAARIKKEEAEAKARAAAVRYLATVDCRYYPEAEAALINSLRADTSECVRIEAARALASGCCCTKRTMAALLLVLNGGDSDNHPAEHSECVKCLAFLAMQRCLEKYAEPVKPAVRPEKPEAPKKPVETAAIDLRLAAYYRDVVKDDPAKLVAESRKVVAAGLNVSRETLRKLSGRPATLQDKLSVEAPRPAVGPRETPPPPLEIAPILAEEAGPERRPSTSPPTGQRNLLQMWRSSYNPVGGR